MGTRRGHAGLLLLGIALAGLLLLASCTGDNPQNTFTPKGDNAQTVQDVFLPIMWITVGILVVVEGLLIFAFFRFRAKKREERPAPVHGNTRLEVAWTIAPAVILLGIAIPTIKTIVDLSKAAGPEALTVRVIGSQWWWEFEYPNENIVTANELHVPVGQPVALKLESRDVIHSFWVPQLAGKTDLIPGRVNTMKFKVNTPGAYLGQCAEFCGISHANMKLKVVVQAREDFEAWVRLQQKPGTPVVDELAPDRPQHVLVGQIQRGAEVFAQGPCVGCHTVKGTAAQGRVGPDLTHFGSRTTLAAGIVENTPENLAKWLQDPPGVKPGAKMPNLNLSEAEIAALVAYLESLK